MKTTLFKRKRGAPKKLDLGNLKKGHAVRLGDGAQENPYPYVAYWNKKNTHMRIEVWRDENNVAYAKRVK